MASEACQIEDIRLCCLFRVVYCLLGLRKHSFGFLKTAHDALLVPLSHASNSLLEELLEFLKVLEVRDVGLWDVKSLDLLREFRVDWLEELSVLPQSAEFLVHQVFQNIFLSNGSGYCIHLEKLWDVLFKVCVWSDDGQYLNAFLYFVDVCSVLFISANRLVNQDVVIGTDTFKAGALNEQEALLESWYRHFVWIQPLLESLRRQKVRVQIANIARLLGWLLPGILALRQLFHDTLEIASQHLSQSHIFLHDKRLDCQGMQSWQLVCMEEPFSQVQKLADQQIESCAHFHNSVEVEWEEYVLMEREWWFRWVKWGMIQYRVYQVEHVDYRSLNIISQFECFWEIIQDLVDVTSLFLATFCTIKLKVPV